MSEEDKKKPAQQEQLDGSDQVAVRQAKLIGLCENGQTRSSQTGIKPTHPAKRLVS